MKVTAAAAQKEATTNNETTMKMSTATNRSWTIVDERETTGNGMAMGQGATLRPNTLAVATKQKKNMDTKKFIRYGIISCIETQCIYILLFLCVTQSKSESSNGSSQFV